MRNLLGFAVAVALLSPQAVLANDDFKGLGFGGSAGTFIPTGSKLRKAFGDDRFTFGFRPVAPKDIPSRWMPDFGFDAISAEKGDNKLAIFPITFGAVRRFGGNKDLIRPYIRAGVGVAYMDYAYDNEAGRRIAAKRLAPAGNIEAGLNFAGVAKLAATYHVFPEYDNTDFNGLEISVTVTLFKF